MSDPSVFCMMLTADRQAFAERAVRCFLRQTYENRRLLIYDSGGIPFHLGLDDPRITVIRTAGNLETIGQARNSSMKWATSHDDIVCHWDDDDISYPNRITEQVAALQELRAQGVGVDVVGSRSMWFWDTNQYSHLRPLLGAAWYYLHPRPYYCVTSSMAYWRSAWERAKFPDTSRAEGHDWLRALNSSIGFIDRQWVIGCIHEGNRAAYDESRKPNTVGFARGTAGDDARIRAVVEAA